jgi:hypothetical protein
MLEGIMCNEYVQKIELSVSLLIIYCMKQSPSWEANRFSTSLEIPPILWTQKFHIAYTSAHHLPPNWIIGFVLHCIPIFLRYLTDAEYVNISWSVVWKSTLMIPSNFVCIWS